MILLIFVKFPCEEDPAEIQKGLLILEDLIISCTDTSIDVG